MKSTLKYMLSALLVAGSLVACSPEKFEGVNEVGVPQVSAFTNSVKINVDQSINQVSLTLDAPEVYPIWTITLPNGKEEKSTVNGYTKIYTNSGDYTVTVSVGNRNGISDASYTTTFHIDNSIVDFGKYTTMLSKAPWHIANKEKGHLACGEPGTDGTNWWSGDADCKLNEGVYDNELTFTTDFKYTFNPGDHGTIYVNKDVTIWPDFRNPDEDFNVPVELQNTEYGLEVDGDDLYLTFKKGTYFPYIANDDIWNTPKYKVVNLTTKKMTLLIDNGAISWQYILTTENTVEKAFTGFDYNSPDNLWKQANAAFMSLYYAHGGGWEGLPDYEHSEANDVYTVKLPTATDMQWQAQYALSTELNSGNITPGTLYDFSCKVVSTTDLPSFTAKLTSPNDDPSLVNNQGGPAKINAYEDTYIYFTELVAPEFDGNYKFVFDFGGCPENTEVTISNIVIIEHSKNKIVPPSEEPEEPKPGVIWADVNSAANLMTKGTLALASTWVADDGWAELADQPTVEISGRNALVTMLAANGGTQWQGQVHLNTGVAIEEGKVYDFSIILTPSQDIAGATVKPHPDGDDGHFFSEGRHDLASLEANRVTYENYTADFSSDNLVITLDFPGCAAGTTIEVKDIIIQEHNESAGGNGGGESWVDVNSPENLMNSGALALASTWVADDNWSPVANQPTVDFSGNNSLITFIDANGGTQWQGQVHYNTGVVIEEGKVYDFAIILTPSQDIAGATVKPHPDGDDGHFFSEGRHDLAGFEDNRVTYTSFLADFSTDNLVITLDFPGCAAGTEIEVKDIIIQEHKGGSSSDGGTSGGTTELDYNDPGNLWKAVDAGDAFLSVTPWFATQGWSQIDDPVWDHEGNVWELTIPEGMGGDQWQGQFPINTNLTAAKGEKYSFSCTIMADENCPGVTIKLTETDDEQKHDQNFFFADRHDIEQFDIYTYTITDVELPLNDAHALSLFFDFGGTPVGTSIVISDITFIKQ